MPLVSIVPGVILMMGGGFWLSLTIAVLAGISAAPVGSYIAKRLPPFVLVLSALYQEWLL